MTETRSPWLGVYGCNMSILGRCRLFGFGPCHRLELSRGIHRRGTMGDIFERIVAIVDGRARDASRRRGRHDDDGPQRRLREDEDT